MNILKWFLRFLIDTAAAVPTVVYTVFLYGFDDFPWRGIPEALAYLMFGLTPLVFGLVNSMIGIVLHRSKLANRLRWLAIDGHSGIVRTTLKFNFLSWLVWTLLNIGIILLTAASPKHSLVEPGGILYFSAILFSPLVIVSMLTTRFIAQKDSN